VELHLALPKTILFTWYKKLQGFCQI